jgi:dynein heavy chain
MSSSDEEDERLADDGPLDASDKRVRWLAEKVSAGLGCDVDLFASCVANDDETRDRVEAFVRGALLRPRLSRRIPPQRHPRRARVGSIHGSRGLLTSFPPTPHRTGTSESEALLVYVEPNARGDAPAGTRSTPFEQSSSGNENAEATVDAPEDGGGEPEQNGERATEAVDASSRALDDPRDDVAAFAEGDGPEPSPGDQGPNAEGASRMDGTRDDEDPSRREDDGPSSPRARADPKTDSPHQPSVSIPDQSKGGAPPALRVAAGSLPSGAASAPAAYFIKDSPAEVLRRAGDMEARVHFGALASSGPSLDALEQLIKQVFVPLLGANGDGADAEGGGVRRGGKAAAAFREKSANMSASPPPKENVTPNVGEGAFPRTPFRATVLSPAIAAELATDAGLFGERVRRAARRLASDVALSFPNLSASVDLTDARASAEDADTARKLEAAVVEWTVKISDATRREEARRLLAGAGPLDEIEFWRERDIALTSLHEQLVAPRIRDAVAVVAVASPAVMPDFEEQAAKLARMRAEARDNRKFLATLERHFRNVAPRRDAGAGAGVSGSGSGNADSSESSDTHASALSTAIDTVAPMMNTLRMVWIISRHYGDDTRMGGLLGRVADEIGRVASEVADAKNPATGVFAVDATTALSRVRDAKRLLDTWRDSYMAMRDKIEKSGRDNRWEFDRKRLFQKTEYVASVCGDLERMLDAVHGFHRFLGSKLKTVTGEPEAIDEVIARVTDMARAARSVEFDIFDPKRFADWQVVVSDFERERELVEKSAKAFVDQSFKKLRSAEDAFDLLSSFERVESSGAIGRTMSSKFHDILEQFTREIVETRNMFDHAQHKPPLPKNQPPVAGAIAWSRSLFSRIRKTMTRLQTDAAEAMAREPLADACARAYTDLAKTCMRYEKRLHGAWVEGADQTALRHLKSGVLKDVSPERAVDSRGDDTSKKDASASRDASSVVVNFHPELATLLRESRYLDRMGFSIPETALKVTLREDAFVQCREALRDMLARYAAATEGLTEVERELLSEKVAELKRSLSPGFKVLNWMSLGILEFVQNCDRAINEFAALVGLVRKNSGIVAGVVAEIASTTALVEPPAGGGHHGLRRVRRVSGNLEAGHRGPAGAQVPAPSARCWGRSRRRLAAPTRARVRSSRRTTRTGRRRRSTRCAI